MDRLDPDTALPLTANEPDIYDVFSQANQSNFFFGGLFSGDLTSKTELQN
jgi:hypothetical protein